MTYPNTVPSNEWQWQSERPIVYTCYATANTPNWFPSRPQGATLDYCLDVNFAIDPAVDFPFKVSAAIAPSGDGELISSNLTYNTSSNLITVTLAQGVPCRVYTVMFTLWMLDGRIYEIPAYQSVAPGLPGYPQPFPPDPGFGDAITWLPGGFNFTNPVNSGYIALFAGI